ncbi:MAG: hypothetical protein JXQ27_00535 [Acidobacteria bacterium]|nr:hypothetical protein [Acidobacteriota bacterium]
MPLSYSSPVTASRTVTRCYCPNGHNLLDIRHPIHGLAGIRLKFVRPGGQAGEVVLSPTLGCFDKLVLAGEMVNGEKLELHCPVCGSPLAKRGMCNRRSGEHPATGDLCLIYLTSEPSPEEAIMICNVVGCNNSSLRHAGMSLHA